MENIQIILNTLVALLMVTFALLIVVDFCAGLINLWDCQSTYFSQPETGENPQLPDLTPVVKQVNVPQARYTVSSKKDEINTESLEQLIQKLPQSRLRTAARRLGIAVRVDGKYQKLAVLRMHLQAKLESYPIEVALVLGELRNAKT
ncbi:hypothetical protein [Calothrix sp. PCC 6303]|uniref:hypothetical protein n=1 Tax=Calothrix sp. PCC 6303 TaxID=1170562 RepID=UPI0002A0467B|nr:hypothetical protein [Calothrix sp. PCC 6303]AFZ01704.1 hypothetical protein Cal6303_2733 [Calothrix sp. PCC 6303]